MQACQQNIIKEILACDDVKAYNKLLLFQFNHKDVVIEFDNKKYLLSNNMPDILKE